MQIRAALSADLAALARTWRAAVQSGCGAFTLPGVSASHVLAVAEKVEATADALGSGTGIMEGDTPAHLPNRRTCCQAGYLGCAVHA